MLCPRCNKIELKYYNGSLGYESLTCPYCNLDIKSEEAITACNIYESKMRAKIKDFQDKLHRRNMQIKELKKEVQRLKEFEKDWIKKTLKEVDPEGTITIESIKTAIAIYKQAKRVGGGGIDMLR